MSLIVFWRSASCFWSRARVLSSSSRAGLSWARLSRDKPVSCWARAEVLRNSVRISSRRLASSTMSASASRISVPTCSLRLLSSPVTRLARWSRAESCSSRLATVRERRDRPSSVDRTYFGLSRNSVAMTVSDFASWSVSMRSVVVVGTDAAGLGEGRAVAGAAADDRQVGGVEGEVEHEGDDDEPGDADRHRVALAEGDTARSHGWHLAAATSYDGVTPGRI